MPQAIHEAKKKMYQCYHAPSMSVQAYYDRFINLVDVIEHIEGTFGTEPGVIKDIALTKRQGYE
jgi:hypothetical protein